jgi:hypothetical protein
MSAADGRISDRSANLIGTTPSQRAARAIGLVAGAEMPGHLTPDWPEPQDVDLADLDLGDVDLAGWEPGDVDLADWEPGDADLAHWDRRIRRLSAPRREAGRC